MNRDTLLEAGFPAVPSTTNVYILYYVDYFDCLTVGAFSSREQAEQAKAKYPKKESEYVYFTIDEMVLDRPDPEVDEYLKQRTIGGE